MPELHSAPRVEPDHLKSGTEPGVRDIGSHLREIRSGASIGFSLKAVGFGGTLLLSVVATRGLGADASGLFFLALTIVTILSTVARVGLDKPLVRQVAGARAVGDADSVRRIVTTCVLIVGTLSVAIAATIHLASDWLSVLFFNKPELRPYLVQMSWAIPALAISGYVGLAFQGISRIALHLLFFSVLTPIVVVLTYFLAQWSGIKTGLAESFAIGATMTAVLGLISWQLTARWPARMMSKIDLSRLLASSRATLTITFLQLMMTWVPTILLGAMAASSDVAAYHVSLRLALLIGFVLVAVNGISAPKFASLHATGQLHALEETVIRTTRIAALAAVPIALILLFWPESVLKLFGSEFETSGNLLRVLAIGYLVNTSTGSVANLLLMTGHERSYRNICLAGAVTNTAVAGLAIWRYGAIGAAWATTSTLIVISLGAAVIARRKLGFSGLIRSSAAGGG